MVFVFQIGTKMNLSSLCLLGALVCAASASLDPRVKCLPKTVDYKTKLYWTKFFLKEADLNGDGKQEAIEVAKDIRKRSVAKLTKRF